MSTHNFVGLAWLFLLILNSKKKKKVDQVLLLILLTKCQSCKWKEGVLHEFNGETYFYSQIMLFYGSSDKPKVMVFYVWDSNPNSISFRLSIYLSKNDNHVVNKNIMD